MGAKIPDPQPCPGPRDARRMPDVIMSGPSMFQAMLEELCVRVSCHPTAVARRSYSLSTSDDYERKLRVQ